MTTSHSDTAFQATFASFRLVQGRKVAQLIFELPIEAADNALSVLGGVPNPEQTRWVGIARIDPKATKPKLSGKDLWRASSECAMLCKEPKFWDFLNDNWWYFSEAPNAMEAAAVDEKTATNAVRRLLGCDSRSSLDSDPDMARKWGAMKLQYEEWKTHEKWKAI
jgi:hypothetical protein